MFDGVSSCVLIPGEGELHGEDARRYMEEQDRLDAASNAHGPPADDEGI